MLRNTRSDLLLLLSLLTLMSGLFLLQVISNGLSHPISNPGLFLLELVSLTGLFLAGIVLTARRYLARKNKNDTACGDDEQEMLQHLNEGNVPPTWRVFRVSCRKLSILIIGLYMISVLFIGFLLYLIKNYAVPLNGIYEIVICILLAVFVVMLSSIILWQRMKHVVLVITPKECVFGDRKKAKKGVCVSYQDVAEMDTHGGVVMIYWKTDQQGPQRVDCNWFAFPAKAVAASLIAAFRDFKATTRSNTQRQNMEDISPVPLAQDEVDQAAQKAHLGKLVHVFRIDIQHVQFVTQMGMFIFCLCIVCFVPSLLWVTIHHWPLYIGLLPWILLAPVPICISVWAEWKRWMKAGEWSVSLYDYGLICDLLSPGEHTLEVVPWKNVVAVWPHRRGGCFLSYTEDSSEETLLLIHSGFGEHILLTKSIFTQITRTRLPEAIEDFERGETCSFVRAVAWNLDENRAIVEEGVLVTRHGLRYKRQFLPWNDVASIEAKGKHVIIQPHKGTPSPRISLSTFNIANSDVLVGLVSHVLQQRNGE